MAERFENDAAAESVVIHDLGAGAFAGRRRERERRGAPELHVCPACGSDLVFPIDWAPAADTSWIVRLRCPDCEWTGGGVYPQRVVDHLDEALDLGTEAVLNDLALLARANMEAEIERFALALGSGHLLPEDF